MSTITLGELITDALELSGRAGTSADASVIRAVNKAVRWVWRSLSMGHSGFAKLETEILTPATGERVSLAAGQGGELRPDGTPTNPIVRSVHKVRGVYRPTDPGGTQRYPSTWTTRESYYDEFAPSLDEDVVARPGYYWAEQTDDGVVDDIVLRPQLSGQELIRLVYTPDAPVLANTSDTLALVDNAVDAIVHKAGYYLLAAQDQKSADRLEQKAVIIVQESIMAYRGERAPSGPKRVGAFRRNPVGRGRIWR